eukprot:GHVR01148767.1.p1 GENE.GHVR01148767.1~~GHVR01148767.1.p1  ORF type:complete len:318 (+),score=46.77 GHVR01148767.1:2-955(+)
MVDTVSPYLEAASIAVPSDIPLPPTLGMLSRFNVGEVVAPETLPCLGHPLSVQESLDRSNGLKDLSKKGVFPTRTTLVHTYFLPPNQSHVPIREKFVGPPLFSKAVVAAKAELEFLHAQEISTSRLLSKTLHLATTSIVGCSEMMREDVPWDIFSLLQGQGLLIEAQVADLLLDFVRLTLRQRDVLLQNVSVSEKDKEALRGLPLFEKELFPVDFEALELRINSERTREQKLAMFTELARKSVATPVVSAPHPAQSAAQQPAKQGTGANQQQPHGGAYQHLRGGRGGRGGRDRGTSNPPSNAQRGNCCSGRRGKTQK